VICAGWRGAARRGDLRHGGERRNAVVARLAVVLIDLLERTVGGKGAVNGL
jgi:hypothetical protein